MLKEFRSTDLFDIQRGSALSKAEMIPGNINYISATSTNNGVSAKISNNEHLHPGGTITVTCDGSVGEVFLQEEQFWASSIVAVWYPRFEADRRVLFYIMTVIKKLGVRYNYTNKWGINKMKNEMLLLPVVESPEPEHEYTIDDLDFDYMRERIAELEEERIAELEEERIAELDAYLIASGLDDYELTDEDKEVLSLSLSPATASDEIDATGDYCGDRVVFEKFVYSDLFKLLPQSFKVAKADFVPDGKTPAYSSDTNNNGCLGFVDKTPSFCISNDAPVYLVFGDHTRTMNIVHEDFCVMDNVKVLTPFINMSDEVLLYVITCWRKAIPNLGYARHWSVAKTAEFELPVIKSSIPDYKYTVNDIDFDYMERYVRALEKLAIADVVKYKDDVITTTKQVIGVS